MISSTRILALCVAGLLAGCAIVGEQRIRRYFEIPAFRPVDITTIRSAILNQVPIGSSVTQIHAYLERAGIGKDKFSSYGDSLISEQPQTICWVFRSDGFPCTSEFHIIFIFADAPLGRDAMNNVIVLPHKDILKEIRVEESGACL